MAPFYGSAIFFVTVGLSLARPRVWNVRVEPHMAALVGAAATLLLGLIPVEQLASLAEFLWKPVLTLASLMVVTIVADRSGLFKLLAWRLARAARGDARRLFAYVFIGGAVMGAFFNNDATVLILTPLVFRIVEDAQGDERWTLRQKLPYYFAVLYAANLVGPFLVSNPIHLVVTRWFDIGFLEHTEWMVLPAIASMVVTLAGLWLAFRKWLPQTYTLPSRPTNSHPRFTALSALILVLTVGAFFIERETGVPVPFVAASGAIAMLILHGVATRSGPQHVAREMSWEALVFVVCIFVVINGLRAVGVTDGVSDLLGASLEHGPEAGATSTGFLAASASALMNNHPAVDTMAMAIYDLKAPTGTTHLLAYATLIGGDLGPRMLPIGSLAALIWFRMLRVRGVDVSYRTYIAVGVPVTLAAVAVSLGVLLLQHG